MSGIIHHERCPLCQSTELHSIFPVRDHTVSGETFDVVECRNCTARFTQNVPGPESIGAYYRSEDYVSHTDTTKGLVHKLYRLVRIKTLRSKRKLITAVMGKKTGSLLDIGAGTGAFLDEMKKQGWQVSGLEPDPGARERAKTAYGLDLDETERIYSIPEKTFDAVTMWHVLEHVHDLHGYLAKIHSIVKDDGRVFIAVPNFTSADAAAFKQHWAAYDVPRHLYHFSPAAMKQLLAQHSFAVEAIKPMWYDSFYVSMLSNKYRSGSPRIPLAVLTGLRSNLSALMRKERCSSLIYIAKLLPGR